MLDYTMQYQQPNGFWEADATGSLAYCIGWADRMASDGFPARVIDTLDKTVTYTVTPQPSAGDWLDAVTQTNPLA